MSVFLPPKERPSRIVADAGDREIGETEMVPADAAEVMAVLVQLAARLASARDATNGLLLRASQTFADAAIDQGATSLVAAHRAWTLALTAASGNRYVGSTIRRVQQARSTALRDALSNRDRAMLSAIEHQRIVAAIRSRDPEAAAAAVQEHHLSVLGTVVRREIADAALAHVVRPPFVAHWPGHRL